MADNTIQTHPAFKNLKKTMNEPKFVFNFNVELAAYIIESARNRA